MCLFRHDDSENADIMAKELSAKQWIDMAGQVAEAGTLHLLITGGEPLLRPDFCEIWEGIYKQGFIITLYTNATLVTPKIMETLRKYPPHKIGVTIYGASAATYKKVTGSADAFDRTLSGIKALQTLPSNVDFRMTCIKDNLDDYFAVENLIKREFGPDNALDLTRMVVKAVRGGCADVESCRLSPAENVDLLRRRLEHHMRELVGYQVNARRIGFDYEKAAVNTDPNTLIGCHAGMNSYTVSYQGELLLCQLLEQFSIRIADESKGFTHAWKQLPNTINMTKDNSVCQNCSMLNHCCDCYAFRIAETGGLAVPSQYICEDAFHYHQLFYS